MLTAFYILTGVVAVVLIAAALIPATFTVRRNIFIQQPASVIFDFILDLNNFNRWNPWYEYEPNAGYTIVSNKRTGDSYSWKGAGQGKITITNIIPDNRIETQIEFIKPWKKIATSSYVLQEQHNGVVVTWQYDGTGSYPVGRFFNLLMDRFLGKDFEKGLKKLKTETEKIVTSY